MTALVERHVLAGSIGGVVRGMAVVRGQCVPEGLDCDEEVVVALSSAVDDLVDDGLLGALNPVLFVSFEDVGGRLAAQRGELENRVAGLESVFHLLSRGLRMITHGNRILAPFERRYASLSRLRDLNARRRPKTRPFHLLVVSIHFLSVVPSWAGAMLVSTLV